MEKKKEQKIYKTRQRSQILNCLIENSSKHLTADEISVILKEKNCEVGKTTVYRSLEKLIKEGSVRKYICEEGRSACFQYVDGNKNCHQHFHLKCIECGKLMHLECDYLSDLEKHIFEHHKFIVDNTKTVLYGVCEECSNE
ncbi:MAG TPA: transcriptional repressor [Ruminococcaceae bacterium]|nr:transcriptional repressor [Oscillospiraceae bacterium]